MSGAAPLAGAPSLASRLSRALTLAVAAAWVVGTGLVAWHVDAQIQHNFDVELVESAHRQLYPALLDVRGPPQAGAADAGAGQPRVMGEIQIDGDTDPLLLQLRNAEGRVLLRTQAAPASPFAVPLVAGFHDTPEHRVFSLWDPQSRTWLQLADPVEERAEARERTFLGLLAVLIVMLPVMAGLVHWIARRELRAVQRLQSQITDRSGSNLQPLHLAHMPRELQAVGEGVNQLLARLGEALNVERSLAANAAHELRTPLAEVRLRLKTALDQALPAPVTGPHSEAQARPTVPADDVAAALHALETLSRRTERLLELSRAEGGDVAHFAPVHLAHLAEQVAQAFWQQPAARKRLDCLPVDESASAAEVTVQGDIDSLAIVLRNLIDNALHHTAGAVELEVRPGPRPAVVVRDQGAGLSAEQLALMQRRHVRVGGQHVGYGLGMSIVRTIAQKHGAELQLVSPPPGRAQGLEVRLVFAGRGAG